MTDKLKKAWLWIKLVFICLVVAWITLFIFQNWEQSVRVWLFFGKANQPTVSVSIIVVATAVAALFVYYVVRKVSSVLKQLNELREVEARRQRDRKLEELARQVEQKQTPVEGKDATGS